MNTLLELPTWQTSVIFLVNEDADSLAEFINKNKKRLLKSEIEELWEGFRDDSIDGQVNTLSKGGYYCMIKSPFAEICWAHEIFHVVNRILTEREVTHDGSAEPWAYLIGYLTEVYLREVIPAVKKEIKERKKKK